MSMPELSTAEPASPQLTELSYIRAVNAALEDALVADEAVIVFGEDVAIPDGPFGATKGLHDAFGDRVFDTPISESAMIGTALGAAMAGLRPVVEVMFGDFLLVAMDQIVNQVAKTRYVSRGALAAPLVIRSQQGRTPGSCAQHSQCLEGLFTHVPGLRVAVPSTPDDAYGILRSAIDLDDPVLVLEARALYPTKGLVRRGAVRPDVGTAHVVRPGGDVTVVTWGTCRPMLQAMLESDASIDAELIDLRWLAPWDSASVVESVTRTGRLLVVHEANESGGFGAEVVSTVAEALGSRLRGARRVGLRGSPVPASPGLADAILPSPSRVREAITSLLEV